MKFQESYIMIRGDLFGWKRVGSSNNEKTDSGPIEHKLKVGL